MLWVLLRGPIDFIRLYTPPQVRLAHPRLGKCALLRRQCTHNQQLLYHIFVTLGQGELSANKSHAEFAEFRKDSVGKNSLYTFSTFYTFYLFSNGGFRKDKIASLVCKHPDGGNHLAGTDARCVLLRASGWSENVACYNGRTCRATVPVKWESCCLVGQ